MWNDDLMTALSDQLVGRYMRDLGSRHGAYVVAWPDIESWDVDDRTRAKVAALDRPAVEMALHAQAAALADDGWNIKVVILDIAYRRPATS